MNHVRQTFRPCDLHSAQHVFSQTVANHLLEIYHIYLNFSTPNYQSSKHCNVRLKNYDQLPRVSQHGAFTRWIFKHRSEEMAAELLVFVLGCLYYISHNAS